MNKKSVMNNYRFLALMLAAMILGCIVGWISPKFGTTIAPFGTVFINMMFCIVVPLVFASISGAVAGMNSRKRAGKIMGTTIAIFLVTGAIAAVIMFVLMKLFPPVLHAWHNMASEDIGEHATMSQMIVNFFTAEDFVGLLSRKAMLPLIVFSLLFGFATNHAEQGDGPVTRWLDGLTQVMLKFVQIITYYAPIAFFAIFANLMATYGSAITQSYGRAMLVYYPLCFIYIFTAFPLFAWFGGGKHGISTMFKHIAKPAIVSLGTCSSVATIPTNLQEAEATGISKDVSEMVCPLGATMHMDGSCFSCVLKIAFVMGAMGTDMSWKMMIPVIAVAVFSSVGMSGVPGGGYIGEYIICSIFFPNNVEVAFPILVAIGNLVDPPATMINSSGDYVVSYMVSRFVDGKDWLNNAIRRQQAEVASAE
ncbi:dicarboxylate/amino acid:cation symporter [Hornefia butyriciproducens]|uniref:dicarboxylate/amino acid:cation symporter n=1 Tax=Hornefia butyriciproducens TaxID=2652293 RepID=UPI002A90F826|nr:dicarboxylate/amino acid:cation symporter [Hornefia butyriciproducens]MDY5423449.1 dicarboxylate/amino acid:cation symporter [Hornefia butyriciproducens]